ncbi:MAG: DUF4832 domain-containing protein, partial [Mycobacteriales bacterium]
MVASHGTAQLPDDAENTVITSPAPPPTMPLPTPVEPSYLPTESGPTVQPPTMPRHTTPRPTTPRPTTPRPTTVTPTTGPTAVTPPTATPAPLPPEAAPAPQAPPTGPPAAGGGSFTPTAIPLTAPEIPNPIRGQYQWISNPPDPADWPAPDLYYRDEIQWGKQVEPTRGQYDFSVFDQGLAAAQAKGGMFSFRVMAACPGCGDNLTPSYVGKQSGGQPDWNSETFLSGYADLMKALGAKYDKDPRLSTVDVGGYGSWGEYHIYELGGDTITPENSKRLVQSVIDAFPSKYIMMLTPGPEYLKDAIALSPKVGIRVDCVGSDGMKGSKIDDVPEALERWKTAPWVGEWCGDAEYTLGLEQVRQYHITSLSSANFPEPYASMSADQQAAFASANKESGYRFVLNSLNIPASITAGSTVPVSSQWSNVGVGPAYLPWNTMIELRNPSTGAIAYAGQSSLDLKAFLPTGDAAATVNDNLAVPATVPTGTYDVYVRVVSPEGYLQPLNLAIDGRSQDGGYRLGSVQVAGA